MKILTKICGSRFKQNISTFSLRFSDMYYAYNLSYAQDSSVSDTHKKRFFLDLDNLCIGRNRSLYTTPRQH